MAHPVNFFQIQGSDGKSLQAFYKKVFAWRMSPDPSGSAMMVEPEPGGIPGGIGPTMDGQNRSITVYISVSNLAAQLATIEKAGGKVAMPPMKLPGGMGSIAGFIDPAGNWVGLWQAAAKAAPAKRAKKAAKKAAPKPAAKKAAARPKKK